jgi:predicted dienelactone hydrolase
MRPLEIAGFVLAVLPALALLSIIPRQAGIAAAGISCVVLVAAAAWLGAYWQLIPLYLAATMGLAGLLWLSGERPWIRVALAGTVACLLVSTAAFACILPMFQLPKPTGPYKVGTRIVHLVDPKRMETHVPGPPQARQIMVQFWYPASPDGQHLASYRRRRETTLLSSYMGVLWTHSYKGAPVAASAKPFPVLLFNPAWQGQRTQNTYQTEDLASHGFIVAAIDHTYNSTPVAFPDGRVIWATDIHDITDFDHTTVAQQISIGDREVHIEAGDDILALDYLSAEGSNPSSRWFGRVNADNAGAFGHSFGGAVAGQTCYQDSRVKAAIDEDGWMFGDVSSHGLDKPFLVMYEEPSGGSSEGKREAQLDAIDASNVHRGLRQFGGYLVTILGTRHFNFADRSLYSPLRRLTDSGEIAPQRAHEIVENYTLQFFSHYLKGKPAPLLAAIQSPYKEVQFENWYRRDAVTQ